MRAAKMKERPDFVLMKQNDVQNLYYMQMPMWLFSDPRYCELSLDAKVAYTFLLNRFQLSRRNGWVNEQGEVFVIFPRKALAAELRVCEQRVTSAFKALVECSLVWEKRCGRGDANQIYLAAVEPVADPDYACAPFLAPAENDCGSRSVDSAGLDDSGSSMSNQEPQNLPLQTPKTCVSRTTDTEGQEPQNPLPKKKDNSSLELSQKEVSQFVPPSGGDGQADDEEELMDILDGCELYCFDPEIARVFENAIERLFYSDSVRVGNATLPQSRVRSKLRLLDGMILRGAENKLRANLERSVKNSTAYTMATVFNAIAESESDLLVDPYLNSLSAGAGRR